MRRVGVVVVLATAHVIVLGAGPAHAASGTTVTWSNNTQTVHGELRDASQDDDFEAFVAHRSRPASRVLVVMQTTTTGIPRSRSGSGPCDTSDVLDAATAYTNDEASGTTTDISSSVPSPSQSCA